MSKHEAEAAPKKAHAEVKHSAEIKHTGDQAGGEAGEGKQHPLVKEASKILSSKGGNEAAHAADKHKATSSGEYKAVAAADVKDLTIVDGQAGSASAARGLAAKDKGESSQGHARKAEAAEPQKGSDAQGDKTKLAAAPEAQGDKAKATAAPAAPAEAAPLRIVDKSAAYVDSFKNEETKEASDKAGTPPKISVSLQEFDGNNDKKEPHYVVKKDGTVEMHGDPVKMGSKEVRVEVERDPGAVNPSEQQLAVTNQLVGKINSDLQTAYPQDKDKIQLDDQGDLVDSKTEKNANLKPTPDKAEMTPETRESVDQTKRLRNSGGVDMPRAATDGMGSFESRNVPRQQGETDKTAAMKEAWAGLFKPDKDHPYETVRRHPDGQTRVGRYGFNANQLENWLNGLTPEQIEKLIAEGKLPKSFADPKFLEKFKAMLGKMKNGEQPTSDEMKTLLPKEAQETIAGQILDKLGGATGNNAGMAAAAAISGRDAGTIDQSFMQSDSAKELSQAGQSLYDIATRRQNIEGNVVGRMPEGDRAALITKALEIAGKPVTESNIKAVNLIVNHESSWNPNSHNDWDSNARKGIPSQGLMQTIPPTFNAHKDRTGQVEAAGYRNTIKDPLANLVAGINYSYSRYGSLSNVPGVRSIARGGDYKPY